ncbi:MAG: aminotransferase class IV [Candidatus Omnitrophica bacterium]|nr:aminotransferase class IV [Candidatus Omnitrophota bacterium]
MKIFLNGKIIKKENLSEIFEPGFLFGWGTFEVLRAYDGNIPFLDLHTRRLNESLKFLRLDEVKCNFENEIKNLLKINNLKDAYIRLTAYKKRENTGLIIYVDKFGYYPKEAYKKGFRTIISPYKRNTKSSFYKIKSLSYLENRLSWYHAQKQNKDEALILNEENFLVGGSRSNLFLVKDGLVFAPKSCDGVFLGITRNIVIELLKDLRIKYKEKRLTKKDLFSCDEAFLTSSLLEVMPLVECEDKKIKKGYVGNITLKILECYRERCFKKT